MKKSKIITIITAVLAVTILVIIGVLIFGNNLENKNEEIIKVDKGTTNVQPDIFKATVISIDATKLTVVASEDSAIAHANNARMVDVIYDSNVTVLQAEQTVDISTIQVGQEITISYDGNIIIASPITIKADKIEF